MKTSMRDRSALICVPGGSVTNDGAPLAEIPVVVGEVMERRLGDRPAHRPAVGPPLTVDDDGKIEATTGRRASAVREHSGFGHRRGHTALMRVRGKPLDPPARGQVGVQQCMRRPVGEHRLIVAVGAGVIVGPGNRRGVLVVAPGRRVHRLVMELVDLPDRAETQQTSAQILVVARRQHTPTIAAKAHNRLGLGVRQPVTDVHRHQP